jgi:CheY-like chemotaxis protein
MAEGFETKRVLLVEDQVLVGMMISEMLEELGFRSIEHVVTLAAAMSAAKERPPDLAILDLHVTDGITLPVAELLALRGIRSIFITGDRDALSFHRIANELVLGKPFSPADLQTSLRYAFDNPLIV